MIVTTALDATNNDIFIIHADIVIRTIGASGTFVAEGLTLQGVAGTTTARGHFKASTIVDTTAAVAVDVTATWSVANSGNTCRLDILNVELIRRK